ncbi:MAG TPA: TlpA disulfide reductase family protein, partial [Acidimicrobiales bacterium]
MTDSSPTSNPLVRRDPRRLVSLAALAVVGLGALVAGVVGFGGGDDREIVRISDDLEPGDLEPSSDPPDEGDAARIAAIPLITLDGSETTTLASLRGGPVVLNFFASWCAPCVSEMPEFDEVHRARGDEVTIVGVNTADDRPSDGQRIVEATGVTYRILRDDTGDLFGELGAFAMPTTVLIDAEGNVVRIRGGIVSRSELNDLIDELLA